MHDIVSRAPFVSLSWCQAIIIFLRCAIASRRPLAIDFPLIAPAHVDSARTELGRARRYAVPAPLSHTPLAAHGRLAPKHAHSSGQQRMCCSVNAGALAVRAACCWHARVSIAPVTRPASRLALIQSKLQQRTKRCCEWLLCCSLRADRLRLCSHPAC